MIDLIVQNYLNYKNKDKFYPLSMELELTRKCNLNCWHCWRNFKNVDFCEIEDKVILDIIDFFYSKTLKKIEFPGSGEPFLRKELIFEIINKYKVLFSATTNGTLFKFDDIYNLCKNGFNTIYFSIDSIGKKHDKNRGIGVFSKIDNTLIEFQAIKKSLKTKFPMLKIKSVLFNNELEELFNYALKRGIDEIFFLPFEDYKTGKINMPLITDKEIKKIEKYNIANNLSEFINDFSQSNQKDSTFRCFYPWYNFLLSSDGFAGPCCNTTDFKVNSVSDAINVWKSKFSSFREGNYNYCKYCSNFTPKLWNDINRKINHRLGE